MGNFIFRYSICCVIHTLVCVCGVNSTDTEIYAATDIIRYGNWSTSYVSIYKFRLFFTSAFCSHCKYNGIHIWQSIVRIHFQANHEMQWILLMNNNQTSTLFCIVYFLFGNEAQLTAGREATTIFEQRRLTDAADTDAEKERTNEHGK